MKRISLLVILALAIQGLRAQVIHGRVVDDSTGTGLEAASVILSGTSKGTTTGSDGQFTVSIPSDGKKHSISISHAGYETVKREVSGTEAGVVIRLKRAEESLNDVVVIGYQTVRRKDVLASVSSISSRDVKDIPLNSAPEALAGRLAGVQVTGSEGSPDAQVLIRVRGGGSITQSNNPLYVVDGVQIDNALNFINLQDIASIDVLKDAAATAIYGARGSNGVVIITTKGGHNSGGKTTISYSGFAGVGSLSKELPVLNPYEYMYYQYERAQETGDTTGIAPYGGYNWNTVQNYKNVPFFDWQKKMIGRNAFQQTHIINLSGGTQQTQYYLSLAHNDQDGVMLLSNYHRNTVNFRFDHQAAKNLKIGANVRYNNTIVNGAGTSNPGSSSLNFLRQIIRYRPFLGAGQTPDSYDAAYTDETNANSLSLINPVLLNQAQYRKNTQNILDLSGYAEYHFTPWLSFRTTFGYDNNTQRKDAFDDTLTYNSKSSGGGLPLAAIDNTVIQTIDNSNVFTYSNANGHGKFHDHNTVTVIAGEETYQTDQYNNNVQTNYFPVGTTATAALANMNLGTPPAGTSLQEPKPTSAVIPIRQFSLFGRASYSFDDKYLAAVSLRADASSLFNPNIPGRQWGYFPAVSAAWRVSKENFMSNVTWVTDLKLRVAYGQAGNNRISPYLYQTSFGTNVNDGLAQQLITTYTPGNLSNPDLRWESTTSRNLGVDASLFNSRLGLSVDVYRNTTDNLLINVPVSSVLGYTSELQNVGATSNNGVELQLNGMILQRRKFTWSGNFNISFNQNKIVRLAPGQTSYLQNSGWAGGSNPADFIVQVGQPVGAMYGYVSDGFYKLSDFNYDPNTRVYTLKAGEPNDASVTASQPMPGSIKYKKFGKVGDSTISANTDRTILGNAQPKFFGGLSQQFSYGGFDCSIFINFQYGNKIFNDNKLEFSSGYTPGANLLGIMKNRWHTVDQNGNPYESVVSGQVVGASPDSLAALNKGAKYWIPLVGSSSTTFAPNSWAVEDGSFIRINNITIGYSLPASVTQRLHIAHLRIYATANNVATLTGYSGYDPEVNVRNSNPVTPGVDYSAYPRSRTYVGGIQVTF
ncbi:MAG TPA: TonB-dependent receptor [Puia sp.]|nr:TonB-dependent receptor [Puia sp.]